MIRWVLRALFAPVGDEEPYRGRMSEYRKIDLNQMGRVLD